MSLILFSTDDVKIDYVFLNWRNAELLLLLLLLLFLINFTCELYGVSYRFHFYSLLSRLVLHMLFKYG